MAEDTKTEMVLVPVEPTEVMITAGWVPADFNPLSSNYPREVYRAMLAARPSADKAEGVQSLISRLWALEENTQEADAQELAREAIRVIEALAPGTDPAIARLTEELERVSGLCTEHFNRAQSNIKEVARLNDLAERRRVEVAQAIDLERSRTEHAIGQQLLMERRAFAAEAALAQRDADIAKAVEDERIFADAGLASSVANIRQGQSSTPRSEPPSDFDLDLARRWVGYVATAIDARNKRRAALRASSATQADGGGK